MFTYDLALFASLFFTDTYNVLVVVYFLGLHTHAATVGINSSLGVFRIDHQPVLDCSVHEQCVATYSDVLGHHYIKRFIHTVSKLHLNV